MDLIVFLLCIASAIPVLMGLAWLTTRKRKRQHQALVRALPGFFNANILQLFDAHRGLRGWAGADDSLSYKVGFTPGYHELVVEVTSPPQDLKRLELSYPEEVRRAVRQPGGALKLSTSAGLGLRDCVDTQLSAVLSALLGLDPHTSPPPEPDTLRLRRLELERGRVRLEYVMRPPSEAVYQEWMLRGVDHATAIMSRILETHPTGPALLHRLAAYEPLDSPTRHQILKAMLVTYPEAPQTLALWHQTLVSEHPESLMLALKLNPTLFLETIAPTHLVQLSRWAAQQGMMPHAMLLRALETCFGVDALMHTMLAPMVKVHVAESLLNKHGMDHLMPTLPTLLHALPTSARRALVELICQHNHPGALRAALGTPAQRASFEDVLWEVQAYEAYARASARPEDLDAIEAYVLKLLESLPVPLPRQAHVLFGALGASGGAPAARALHPMLNDPVWAAFGRPIKQAIKQIGQRLKQSTQHGHLSLAQRGSGGGLTPTTEPGGLTIDSK